MSSATNRQREKISTGIHRDRFGIAIIISVHGKPKEFRKDDHKRPYRGRSREWLMRERERLQKLQAGKDRKAALKADTFRADVDRYLSTIASPSHKRNTAGYMAHWEIFNLHRRDDITELDIQQHFATLTKKPSTLN